MTLNHLEKSTILKTQPYSRLTYYWVYISPLVYEIISTPFLVGKSSAHGTNNQFRWVDCYFPKQIWISYVCIYIYIHVCMYVCMYIYIYMKNSPPRTELTRDLTSFFCTVTWRLKQRFNTVFLLWCGGVRSVGANHQTHLLVIGDHPGIGILGI